jgi:large subunit ribosomal protein L18
VKKIGRQRRHERITDTLRGTADRPRLVVFRSKKHIYAQIINDAEQRVLTSMSTVTEEFIGKKMKSTNKEAAQVIGKLIAEKAKGLGVKKICFDRAGYMFHGRVKALSDGAREGGLEF